MSKGPGVLGEFAIKHFVVLQDFLASFVVKIDTLFVGTKQCVIHELFSTEQGLSANLQGEEC